MLPCYYCLPCPSCSPAGCWGRSSSRWPGHPRPVFITPPLCRAHTGSYVRVHAPSMPRAHCRECTSRAGLRQRHRRHRPTGHRTRATRPPLRSVRLRTRDAFLKVRLVRFCRSDRVPFFPPNWSVIVLELARRLSPFMCSSEFKKYFWLNQCDLFLFLF